MREYNFTIPTGQDPSCQQWKQYLEWINLRITSLINYWHYYQPDYLIMNDWVDTYNVNKTAAEKISLESLNFLHIIYVDREYKEGEEKEILCYLYNPLILWLHHGLYCEFQDSYWLTDLGYAIPEYMTKDQLKSAVAEGTFRKFPSGTVIFNNNPTENYRLFSNPDNYLLYSSSFASFYTGYFLGDKFIFNYLEKGGETEGETLYISLVAQDRIVCDESLRLTFEQQDLPFYNSGYWNQEKFPPLNQMYINTPDGNSEEIIADYTWKIYSYVFDNSKKLVYTINMKNQDLGDLKNLNARIRFY